MKTNYQRLDDRNHILKRPSMYIGAMNEVTRIEKLIENSQIITKEVSYIPAFMKIINEIIDNTVDVFIKSKGKYAKHVDVEITNYTISVTDDGNGITVTQTEDGIYIPKLCFGYAKAGSNFDDEEDKVNIGTNGVGSYATNCFSTSFVVETCDGKNRYTGIWSKNAEFFEEKIETSDTKHTGTKVEFNPDLERFGLEHITEVYYQLVEQRLITLSIIYGMEFTLNGKKITFTRKNFISLFGEVNEVYEEEKFFIALTPSQDDDFTCFTAINGLNMKDGNHVDYVMNLIVSEIKDKLPKKYKNIKNGDIKNKLNLIFFGKDFPLLVFDSQTKESLKNSAKEISTYLGNDWKVLIKSILSNKDIIKNITEYYDLKVEFENRKSLENLVKPVKKIRIEKYKPAIIENTYLLVSEGNSAGASILAGTGRDYFGAYPLKGKPLNCLKASIQQIKKNQELKDLLEIMGIDLGKDLSQLKTTYEYLLCAADADLDGFSIITLTMSFFMKYYPEFIQQGRFKVLQTPVIIIYKSGKPFKYFLNLESYNAFCENDKSKYDVKYKKGLASITEQEFEWLFSNGIEPFIETLVWCEETLLRYEDWMGDVVDKRKEYLQDKSFDIFNI